MHEVRIFDGEGKLKETVTRKQLTDRWMEKEGLREGWKPINLPGSILDGVKKPPYMASMEGKLWDEHGLQPMTIHGKGKCLNCDAEFNKQTPKQKYCRKPNETRSSCAIEHHKTRTKRPVMEKKCEKCGKKYMGLAIRKYCNDPCGNKKEIRPIPDGRDCALCGRTYKPKQINQIYCRQPCNLDIARAEERRFKRLDAERNNERQA